MAKKKIVYEDGHTFDILGRPWVLRFITSKDKTFIEFLESRENKIAGICIPNREGGTIFVRLDFGNPKETLRHELIEAFLAEASRKLHEPPKSFGEEKESG